MEMWTNDGVWGRTIPLSNDRFPIYLDANQRRFSWLGADDGPSGVRIPKTKIPYCFGRDPPWETGGVPDPFPELGTGCAAAWRCGQALAK